MQNDWPSKIFTSLFEAAQDAPMIGPSRHAAALIIKNQIVCIGTNQVKTHPMMKRFNNPFGLQGSSSADSESERKITIHAEIDAILKGIYILGEDLSACSLYSLRISKGKNISLAKPCHICQRAIDAFGIKQIYWSS